MNNQYGSYSPYTTYSQYSPYVVNPYPTINPYTNPYSGVDSNQGRMPQNPYMQNSQTGNPQPYECRPITGIDEAKAAQVDFTGRPIFYYSAAENKIYSKRLDLNTGAAVFDSFILQNINEQVQQATTTTTTTTDTQENITPVQDMPSKADFDSLKTEINSAISGLETRLLGIFESPSSSNQ